MTGVVLPHMGRAVGCHVFCARGGCLIFAGVTGQFGAYSVWEILNETVCRACPVGASPYHVRAGIRARTCSCRGTDPQYAGHPRGDTSLLSTVDPSGYVASIDPKENAGLLNYCVQNEYVPDYDDAFRTLLEYNKKTNAVSDGADGNMFYAIGSAGQIRLNDHTYTVAMATLPLRQKTCKAVLERAKAAL